MFIAISILSGVAACHNAAQNDPAEKMKLSAAMAKVEAMQANSDNARAASTARHGPIESHRQKPAE